MSSPKVVHSSEQTSDKVPGSIPGVNNFLFGIFSATSCVCFGQEISFGGLGGRGGGLETEKKGGSNSWLLTVSFCTTQGTRVYSFSSLYALNTNPKG